MATNRVKREDSEISMADLPQHVQPPASGLVKKEPADEDNISLRPEDPTAEQTTEYPSAWELAEAGGICCNLETGSLPLAVQVLAGTVHDQESAFVAIQHLRSMMVLSWSHIALFVATHVWIRSTDLAAALFLKKAVLARLRKDIIDTSTVAPLLGNILKFCCHERPDIFVQEAICGFFFDGCTVTEANAIASVIEACRRPTKEVDRAIVMLCNMAKNDDPFIRPRRAQLHTLIVPLLRKRRGEELPFDALNAVLRYFLMCIDDPELPPLLFVLVREIIEFHQAVEGVSTVPWELVLGIMPSIFAFGDSDSD